MDEQKRTFNPKTFLSTVGPGRKMVSVRKRQTIYAQGDVADALFVIQAGTVKLSVKSQTGREAILDTLGEEDFVGQGSLSGESSRSASAIAMTDCRLLRIDKDVMLLALTQQLDLATTFWQYVLARNIQYQQDLVEQHCDRSEKRLARILLRLAQHGERGESEGTIPNICHGTLAEMVGTTRSRVSFFMKRFKDSGLIDYKCQSEPMRIHRSLLAFCN